MRRQDRRRLKPMHRATGLAAAFASLFAFVSSVSAEESATINTVPRLTGAADPMSAVSAPPLNRPVTDDVRRMRSFPEQPPVIPHSIDGYQLTLSTNRCLSCHQRQFTEGSGAPMISVTHFADRDGELLLNVAPRRYFCTACHVQQTDARALVPNRYQYPNEAGRKQ